MCVQQPAAPSPVAVAVAHSHGIPWHSKAPEEVPLEGLPRGPACPPVQRLQPW